MPIDATLPYDDTNIFARILRGEIPCHKVHEDEHTLAFMDVMPQADGHTLVIPKMPSRNLLDAGGFNLVEVRTDGSPKVYRHMTPRQLIFTFKVAM